MFPTGVAGLALILLRFLVAANFLVDGSAHWSLVTSLPTFLLFVIPATFLVVGLFTPYWVAVCILARVSIFATVGGRDVFHLATSVIMGGALGLLGPGAYSLDARLFGRRRLKI